MKNYVFLISCFLFISASIMSCSAFPFGKTKVKLGADIIVPDSLVCAQLGASVTETLFSPTSVTCYLLKGKSEVLESDVQIEPHFVRDTLIGTLEPELYSILQYMLIADPVNYNQDSVMVKSPYMPRVEFEFAKKKTVVHVVVSLSDFSWSVIFDNKKQFNYNYADKAFMARYCTMFLPVKPKEE